MDIIIGMIEFILVVVTFILTIFTLINLYDLLLNDKLNPEQFKRLRIRVIYWILLTILVWYLLIKLFKYTS
jgi:hypothetical protein